MKAASALVTRAFAGSATTDPELAFEWCMPSELQGQWDDPRRYNALEWIFRFLAEEMGVVLVVRSDSGDISGALGLRIYRSTYSGAGIFEEIGAAQRAGNPSKECSKFLYTPRMKAFDKAAKNLHKTAISGPHIYVSFVGVDPGAQGKGIGGRLMRAVSAIADQEKLPCYLETSGSRNTSIYEKYGYKIAKQEEIRPEAKKGVVDVDDSVFTDFYAMVRPAQDSLLHNM
jgi:ribosomal protein S18 acetylase RimI-like enzyme